MACHNGHGARAILTALRSVDTSIAEKDSAFWHKTLRTEGGGRGKAAPESAMKAIDAAWLAATKSNADWSNLTPQQRLDIQAQFRDLRAKVETGELDLTENQVLKLGAYVTQRKATPKIVKIGAVAAGLLASVGVMAGPAAAAEATPAQPIAANSQNASDLHMPVGKDGMCAADFTLAKAGRTHKVTWQKPNGKIVTKTMKKGAKACVYTGANGVTEEAPTNASGAITKLPANFPSKPTAQDITSLGLTPDSKVSPDLRIPQATGTPLTEAKLADTIIPVRISDTTVETIQSGSGPLQKTTHWVEWELTGGDGALVVPDKDPNTGEIHSRYVKLNPNGTTRVTIPMYDRGANIDEFGNHLGKTTYNFPGIVVPDYGQTELPQSTTRDWNLMSSRAMDESGRGYTAGKYANTEYPTWARPDKHPTDGWFNMDDTTHQIVGGPNWG